MTRQHWWAYGGDHRGHNCRYTGRAAWFIAVAKTLRAPHGALFFYLLNIYIYLCLYHVAQIGLADTCVLGGAKYMFFGAIGARRDAPHVDPIGLFKRV